MPLAGGKPPANELCRAPLICQLHTAASRSAPLAISDASVVRSSGPAPPFCKPTHPATSTPAPIGTTRGEVACLLFYTALPQGAFTPADVVDLYLHRGAFECVLSDEDQEQDPDRWCSHTPWGQECWQILSQWLWN